MKDMISTCATVAMLAEGQPPPRRAMWRSDARKTIKIVFATVAIHAATSLAAFAGGSITIGTPNNTSYNLAADLQSAYQQGYTTINIKPGTYYTLTTPPTQAGFVLSGWHDVTINGQGSTIRDENTTCNNNANGGGAIPDVIFELDNCNNVTIENLTITQDADWECQAHVVAVNPPVGSGDETLVVKWDTGYPGITPATSYTHGSNDNTHTASLDGVDSRSLTLKQGSTDYYNYTVTNLNNGNYQIDFGVQAVPMAVGDIIWGAFGWPDQKFKLSNCGNCTLQNVTMNHNGYASIFDDYATASNHYFNIRWAPGAAPPGATQAPVVGAYSDGMDAQHSNFGPDIENCTFTGIIGDDEVAIFNPSTGFKVLNCTFGTGRAHGVYLWNASNGTIQGNKFSGNYQEEVCISGDNTATQQNITITGNTFADSLGGGWPVCGTIPWASSSSNIKITNNLFRGGSNYQVNLNNVSGATVMNNTFLSCFMFGGGSEVRLWKSSGVTLSGNLTQNRGPYANSALLASDSSDTNVTGTANGIFDLDPLCGFVSQLDGQLISDPASEGAGAQLVTYPSDGNANQNWALAAAPGAPGYFTMSSGANGLVADVLPDPGSHPILLQGLSGSYAAPALDQLWTMAPTDSTHVNLVNGQTLNDINIYGGNQAPNSVLVQWNGGNASNDNWLWQPQAYTGTGSSLGTLFSTGFETGQTQPNWSNAVYSRTSNITGVNGNQSPPPQCAALAGGVAHTGTAALAFSGSAPAVNSPNTPTFCYYKSFSTSLPISPTTKMSYWIYPQAMSGEDNARFVAVDFLCTDGSTLRGSGAVDYNGFSMHPGAGHGATSGYDIPLGAWTQIKCDVGQWLAGKTIKTILVGYDERGATGPYSGYIDDLTVTNVPLSTSP